MDGIEMRCRFSPDTDDSARIEPITISGEELLEDDRLQQILVTRLGERQMQIPSVGLPQRLVIDPDSELFSQHEFVQQLPSDQGVLGEILLRYVMIYHEVGGENAASGHFTTLIDPENAVMSNMLPWGDIFGIINDRRTSPRAIPHHYHEVLAFLQEREALEDLLRSDSPFDQLSAVVNMHAAELELLKGVDREVLDELVRDFVQTYVGGEGDGHTADPAQERNPRILRIADYLEDAVGRGRALELLNVPRHATMNPDKWLCHLLHDLESDRDPETIPAHGSYWDTRPPRDVDHDYDEIRERTDEQRQDIIDDRYKRGLYSTYEVVSVEDDRLVRTWYSYRPQEDFPLEHVRYCLLLQELFAKFEDPISVRGDQWHLSVLNDGSRPAMFYRDDQTARPFYLAEYQREGVDPFGEAMAGDLTADRIGSYYEYETDDGLAHTAWRIGRRKATDSLRFDDFDDLRRWVRTGEDDWWVKSGKGEFSV